MGIKVKQVIPGGIPEGSPAGPEEVELDPEEVPEEFPELDMEDLEDLEEVEKETAFQVAGAGLVSAYLRDLPSKPLLTAKQEIELSIKANNGDSDAKRELIECNLRLVVYFAKKYQGAGVPLEDLIQVGNIGLIRAAEMFNGSKGVRFATYAGFWITKKIWRAIQEYRLIHIPAYLMTEIFYYDKAVSRLNQRLGHDPSIEEVAAELKVTPAKVKKIIKITQLEPGSLNMRIGNDSEGFEIGDMLEDREAAAPEERLIDADSKEQFAGMLSILKPRQLTALKMRYGFDTGEEKTLQEIGQVLGVTRERARQLVAGGIKTLKNCSYTKKIKAFY